MNTFISHIFHLGAVAYRLPTFRIQPDSRAFKLYRHDQNGPVGELEVTFSRAIDSIFRTWTILQRHHMRKVFFPLYMAGLTGSSVTKPLPGFWKNGPAHQEESC